MNLTLDVLQLINLLLVPVVGLLWKISTQLAAMESTMLAHDARLSNLENKANRS